MRQTSGAYEREVPTIHNADATPPASNRLIVELTSPPLAVAFQETVQAAAVNGKLAVAVPAAQDYINQIQAEQATFVSLLQTVVDDVNVAYFRNELGVTEAATYQVVFNGLAIDVGEADRAALQTQIARLDGVKNVYLDLPYQTELYTSTALINTPLLWNQVGGRANGGAGIKIASMDGGVHHEAAMMDGTGYTYPPGFGPNGLGVTANNNGKIIVSRAYFRPWDPPRAGDENAWPGERGTSHGMHTASTAAGDIVTASYDGLNVGQMSGVAPKAYVMSYRVFYESVTSNGAFYTTEGLAALDDIVRDGADVVNNSWGDGPKSSGGEFDALDQALINATKAGIFVAMSNGNSGPGLGTGDHASPDYINVAASTTGGNLVSQQVSVPSNPTLNTILFAQAIFGGALPENQVQTFPYTVAEVINPNNAGGCNAFTPNSLSGKAALLEYSGCEFGSKALNAQQAGATFAVVYNSVDDDLITMLPGTNGGQVTIPVVFIGRTSYAAMLGVLTNQGAAAAILRVDTTTHQAGNVPDRIIDFSSRGPGVGGTLKPDIAAPGVNILAQGYTPGASGEARHLGYGQASGTSMAAPHVAGAAALLKQEHPDWSPAQIKSALMSTAKYLDIYLEDGSTPAQPLDMGAGRLDLTHASDPGLFLDPPSLSFGYMISTTAKTISVTLTSVASSTENYTLSTRYTGAGFTQTTPLPGFTLSPTAVTLAPGESKVIQITFDTVQGNGIGDNQGYIVLDGATYDAHLPAWARVTPALPTADLLLIDGDVSALTTRVADYRLYYTAALDELGYTYTTLEYNPLTGAMLPNAATLLGYRAILYFTGDNYFSDGGLQPLDMDKLVEYLNAGGTVIVMGQDMARTIGHNVIDPTNPHFFYESRLGANWIQDSISSGQVPVQPIVSAETAPVILKNLQIDPTQPRAYAGTVGLLGSNEVPPVTTPISGTFALYHQIGPRLTSFSMSIRANPANPTTVTNMHIHAGATGVNGGVLVDLAASAGVTLPVTITDTWTVTGILTPTLTVTQVNQLRSGGLYVNVHTNAHGNGEIRGQLSVTDTSYTRFIDEIDNRAHDGSQDPTGRDALRSVPLFRYPGSFNEYDGTVVMGHRHQPSLENPGITYQGRTVYATFGLESVSEIVNPALNFIPTTRSALLDAFLNWAWSEPATEVSISNTLNVSNTTFTFVATPAFQVQSNNHTAPSPTAVQYRWDFGDGSVYRVTTTGETTHRFVCGDQSNRTVRVEVTDTFGNVAIGSQSVAVGENCRTIPPIYMPIIRND
ncbi:MAG: S8 family serine peptidase [Caldilineaceae bacterium]|nr:S8 family serine peptidase [Caldilineaceae bacterium]